MNISDRTLFIVTLIATLSACAANHVAFYKDGVDQYSAQKDLMACRQLGLQDAMANGLANNMFVEIHIRQVQQNCMTDLGYNMKMVQGQ